MLRRLIAITLSFVLLFLLIGCDKAKDNNLDYNVSHEDEIVNPEETTEEVDIALYFANENFSRSFVQEKRKVILGDKSLEEVILLELRDGPRNKENIRTLPESINIIDVEVVNSIAFVNISSKNLYGGIDQERYLIGSIVLSLTELNYIDKVQFFVDGKRAEFLMGNIVVENPFTRDSVAFKTVQNKPNDRYTMTLYFPQNEVGGLVFVKEERKVVEKPVLQAIIGGLLLGPRIPEANDAIPSNFKILDIESIDGIVNINFSGENLENIKGNYFLEMKIIHSILMSLFELDEVKGVMFKIDGEKRLTFMQFYPIYKPIMKDEYIPFDWLSEEEAKELLEIRKLYKHKIILYYPAKEGFPPKFIKKEIKWKEQPTVEDVTRILINYPPDLKNVNPDTVVPPTLTILNAWKDNDIAYVNFSSKNLELYKDKEDIETQIVACLVKSLCELDDINGVVFLVDGQKREKFIKNVNIDKEIERKLYKDWPVIESE